jgi:hypothetical protein
MLQPEDAVIDQRAGTPARRAGAGVLRARLAAAVQRRRARRARLPWDELEAEAARQGCSPADIFFDRAGFGRREPVEPEAEVPEEDDAEEPEYVPWRGLDPRPRA